MKLFDSLNKTQTEAVTKTEGYVRVIAGAGSGKTRLLTSRYVYLVKALGIDPSNILCVTFTNKAANVMKNRIKKMIGDTCNPSLICTYHGLALKIIKENPEKLFLSNNFQILDPYRQKNILSDIYQKYELKLDYASFESTIKKISDFKNLNNYIDIFINPAKKKFIENATELDDEIIEDYLQKQKNTYSLDFNDLINFAIYLLETYPDIKDKWQKRLNYIQVDEFQDSSNREMKLIDILSGYYKNVLIVGDPDQNIYEWRGSDVKLLIDFDKNHSNTQTIFLNQNYRSTTKILNCANNLIENNEYRLKKDLFTNIEKGEDVHYFHSTCDDDETSLIVKEIKNVIKNNYKYDDIAILYRSNFLSRNIENKLVENNIPYEIYGGVKFYQRMEILDILAYLKLIAYNDDQSLKRIINTPRRRFGRAKFNTLLSLNENSNAKCLYDTLKNNLDNEMFIKSDINHFVEFIDSVKAKVTNSSIVDIVEMVCNDSGYEEYIRSLGDNERLENLSEFKRITDEFERNYGEHLTLNEFLQEISLQTSEDENNDINKVKLMTIHTAKGLEFPIVFIVGLTEGIFPSSRTIEERGQLGLEEERRLCYVAITRAMKKLYLMESEGYSNNNQEKFPSRFLEEIGKDNYIMHGTVSKEIQDGAVLYRKKLDEKITKEFLYEKGDEIEHHFFGKGKIIEADKFKRSYLIKFNGLNDVIRNISFDYFNSENIIDIDIPDNDVNINEEIILDDTITENEMKDITDIENTVQNNSIKNEGSNLWKRNDVPHSDWTCIDVEDLGSPCRTCEMCGKQIIRYVHYMKHNDYPKILAVGCVCAGKMEGNIEAAKSREKHLKTSYYKKPNTIKWHKSSKGNDYVKHKGHVIIVYQDKYNNWKYVIDGEFSKDSFLKKKDAKIKALEQIETV